MQVDGHDHGTILRQITGRSIGEGGLMEVYTKLLLLWNDNSKFSSFRFFQILCSIF